MSSDGDPLNRIRHLVSSKLYEEAIETCQNLELSLQGNYSFSELICQFYSIFLAILLLDGNMNEAKYLWYRIGDGFKASQSTTAPPPASSSDEVKLCLSSIWEVGIALCQNDFAAALKLLSGTTWPEYVHPILIELHDSVLRRFLTTIGSVYKNLNVTLLSNLLQSPSDSLSNVTTIAGWTLQADGTILVPVTSQNTGARSTHAAELEQALTSLSKVSEYVSFMDSKSIKVDLLGKGSSKVSAGK